MEAAGVVNLLPCLLVHGICDYADSQKNKIFQPFAASAAAAATREVLTYLPCTSADGGSRTDAELRQKQALVSSRGMAEASFGGQTRLSQSSGNCTTESLAFEQLDSRHKTVRMAHSKTCRWILSCPECKDWLNPELFTQHHGFLWIKGKPGAGNSTLMEFAFALSS
jgi:hypothetical protein